MEHCRVVLCAAVVFIHAAKAINRRFRLQDAVCEQIVGSPFAFSASVVSSLRR